MTRGVYMRARCATKEMASGVSMLSYTWGMRPVMATPRRWSGAILMTIVLQQIAILTSAPCVAPWHHSKTAPDGAACT